MAVNDYHRTLLQQIYNIFDLPVITLTFGGERVPIHKPIATKASKALEAAFNGGFANATSNEYATDGYSNGVVYAMIKFIYGFKFDDGIKNFDDGALEFYMDVYLIANEYQLGCLKADVAKSVSAWMDELVDSDRAMFNKIFERIITLYDTNVLSELLDEDTLIIEAVKVCIDNRPAYVAEKCHSSTFRYRRITALISALYGEVSEGCQMGKGCSYYSDYECYIGYGEWPRKFREFLDEYTTGQYPNRYLDGSRYSELFDDEDRGRNGFPRYPNVGRYKELKHDQNDDEGNVPYEEKEENSDDDY